MRLGIIAVAFTGIAASLLEDGQTIHSRFGVPLNVDATTTWSHGDPKYQELKDCAAIVMDEISMCSKYIIMGVDRFMRDLCGNKRPFGGKIVIFSGDFRQTLPIVKGCNTAKSVGLCIKNCPEIWGKVRNFSLAENMRASEDPKFSEWLLNIGNGDHECPVGGPLDYAKIPDNVILKGNVDDLISYAFNVKKGEDITPEMISSNFNSAILTPLNEDTDRINLQVLERMTGKRKTYCSADKMLSDDAQVDELYPIENINNKTPQGFPQHILTLKVGSIVMCLKNIGIHLGLCNGTRLKVLNLYQELIECEILYGRHRGKKYYVSRHRFAPDLKNLPLNAFERFQFPLKLAFAMTINKSQGQTFDRIAIYLPQPVFAHGQLYVAFSRVRNFAAVKVLIENKNRRSNKHGQIICGNPNYYTRNVVCKEVLTNE